MAGLGFKDFAVGEVLTSADVDGYLMQQSVMRFADSSARGSALGTAVGTGVPLAEGMVAYLDDVDQMQVYSGTEWLGVGRVLQVVTATDTTTRTTTSGTVADANISITVTPKSASSTLYVEFTGTGYVNASNNAQDSIVQGIMQITDSSNVALEGAESVSLQIEGRGVAGTPGRLNVRAPIVLRGKVASTDTSSRTYKIRFSVSGGPSTTTLSIENASATGRMLVWEVL